MTDQIDETQAKLASNTLQWLTNTGQLKNLPFDANGHAKSLKKKFEYTAWFIAQEHPELQDVFNGKQNQIQIESIMINSCHVCGEEIGVYYHQRLYQSN